MSNIERKARDKMRYYCNLSRPFNFPADLHKRAEENQTALRKLIKIEEGGE